MKKCLLLITSVLVFASCATTQKPAPFTPVSMLDYSLLTERGIFVTESNSVGFDYETIGSVLIQGYGGYVKHNDKKGKRERIVTQDDYYIHDEGFPITKGKYQYIEPSLVDAMITLGDYLKDVGANGIINIKVTVMPEDINDDTNNKDKIVITGMAIRR